MNIDFLLDKLAAPAQRALLTLNIKTIEEFASYPKEQLARLHGIGLDALWI